MLLDDHLPITVWSMVNIIINSEVDLGFPRGAAGQGLMAHDHGKGEGAGGEGRGVLRKLLPLT